ncbi:GABA permease [Alcaligenes faecalis]|uniref:amino acid permease n=1 Tax=Alcaligenes faecalis TaxID=511 RepID=UPI000A2E0A5E|nr:amino acid permease [Alcaligenes faecalis]KAA1284000.1 amino acid permease [Alcaligenes faecalis]OSZ31982.1 GABA permease [Alcaligenes faecalis]OSZ39941.1 GABA permease [Alcaligenes faecalis]
MTMPEQAGQGALAHGLNSRQMSMISIAGIIGAGLFIGSANAIAKTGPAAVLSYILTGALVLLVMRMLGEMAVANPDSGSFSTYAARAIGPWAGFSIGWLYWWFWGLIIPVEAIAGAYILHQWMPDIPSWQFSIVIMVALSMTNLFSVKNFGEFEFWFALIKVLAIIVFIVACLCALTGFWPWVDGGKVPMIPVFSNFAPQGMGAVLAGILITMFSFFGAEIVTIAAAETDNPQEKIRKATNLVVYRISLFYVLSISLIVLIVGYDDPRLMQVGSFQRTLEVLRLPGAKLVVDVVVLIAVTSCMNSGLYTASRMIYSLSVRGDAPACIARVSSKGVPYNAVLVSTLAGFAGCLVNYLLPGQVFSFLLSTTGAIALIVYLVIAVSQLLSRRQAENSGIDLPFKMWLFPWLTYLSIVLILAVLVYMAMVEAYRYQLAMTLGVSACIVLAALMRLRRGSARGRSVRQQEAS